MCYLAPSVQQSCHCMAIYLIFSSLALPISLAHGSGFKNFEEGLFLAISFSTILVDLEEIVGEWLGQVGLFKHSPLVTAPCLLAGGQLLFRWPTSPHCQHWLSVYVFEFPSSCWGFVNTCWGLGLCG